MFCTKEELYFFVCLTFQTSRYYELSYIRKHLLGVPEVYNVWLLTHEFINKNQLIHDCVFVFFLFNLLTVPVIAKSRSSIVIEIKCTIDIDTHFCYFL